MITALLKKIYTRRIPFGLLGLLIAYSLSVHFGNLYDQTLWKKIALVLILGVGFAVLNDRFVFPLVQTRISSFDKK